jgi:hypothetical protein
LSAVSFQTEPFRQVDNIAHVTRHSCSLTRVSRVLELKSTMDNSQANTCKIPSRILDCGALVSEATCRCRSCPHPLSSNTGVDKTEMSSSDNCQSASSTNSPIQQVKVLAQSSLSSMVPAPMDTLEGQVAVVEHLESLVPASTTTTTVVMTSTSTDKQDQE